METNVIVEIVSILNETNNKMFYGRLFKCFKVQIVFRYIHKPIRQIEVYIGKVLLH